MWFQFLVDYADVGRQIIKLTAGLDYVARIEGPKWLTDRHVERDRIAIAHTDYIYLTACGSVSLKWKVQDTFGTRCGLRYL